MDSAHRCPVWRQDGHPPPPPPGGPGSSRTEEEERESQDRAVCLSDTRVVWCWFSLALAEPDEFSGLSLCFKKSASVALWVFLAGPHQL